MDTLLVPKEPPPRTLSSHTQEEVFLERDGMEAFVLDRHELTVRSSIHLPGVSSQWVSTIGIAGLCPLRFPFRKHRMDIVPSIVVGEDTVSAPRYRPPKAKTLDFTVAC